MTDRNSPAAREPAADRWVTLGEAVAAVFARLRPGRKP
jgi:hypothetical protein